MEELSEGRRQNEFENAIFQLIFAKGYIENEELEKHVQILSKNYKITIDEEVSSINKIFERINKKIRDFSFEIKSLALRNETKDDWIYLHGVVNTENDYVAKEYGSNLLTHELKMFEKIAIHMLQVNYMSTEDIKGIDKEWQKKHELEPLLQKLMNEKWLEQQSKGFWALGVRSFLELRTHFEEVIESLEDTEERKAELKATLPNVMIH
jgi:hypothetical protein